MKFTKDSLRVLLGNTLSWPQRIMANYLRRKGWVVFYLESKARTCNNVCWLKLYQSQPK